MVMREGRLWIVSRGLAMHEYHWSKRWRTDDRSGKAPREALPRHAITRTEAHDEIVRM
jgi:hypothetical protein